MEPSSFDDLTKALATSTSRRQVLKTIAASTLGSILGLSGLGSAFAAKKCRGLGSKCSHGDQCCSNYCANNVCSCSPGQTNCNGTCVDLQTNKNNCGACGTTCTGTTPACCSGTCVDLSSDVNNCGSCGTNCATPGVSTPACCSGTCTDLDFDPNNCGFCGHVCSGFFTNCVAGRCRIG